MILCRLLKSYFLVCMIVLTYNKVGATDHHRQAKTTYYFSGNGNDNNDGSFLHPFKTISHINKLSLKSGDTVFLKGGEIFKGNLTLDSTISGIEESPVVVTSYGNGNAIIDAGNGNAVTIYKVPYINISNITCKGSGRKKGNTKNGISIIDCRNINISNIDVSGFQKSGLLIYSSKKVNVDDVHAHDNGSAGITVEGNYENKLSSYDIHIFHCSAVNNPGDPTNLTNHSGNGIVAGHCTNLVIEYCTATNNGWDMPRIGNGPVGIWCYEADSVTIQHCLSYRNKTSVGGADGGGFDLDGGVTNSVIQYCLSYENQGSGYCIFQYWGASPFYNNVIRFNISIDDGLVSDSRAGMYVWNSSGDSTQFYNCDVYNNTVYNSKEAALSFSETSKRKNFRFFNNIFVGKDSLIKGKKGDDIFLANDWWSIEKKFNADEMTDFKKWASAYDKEQLNGDMKGLNVKPSFENPGDVILTDVSRLTNFDNYKITGPTSLTKAGLDLHELFNIDMGTTDFNGQAINKNYLGACTHQ